MPRKAPSRSSSKSSASTRSRASSASRASSSRRGHTAQATTYHDQIRRWAEARGGKPACVRGTGGKSDTGMLRIDFPGYSGAKSLQKISWDDFFEKFDEQDLALLYQEKTAGGKRSNFNKLVSRETAEESGSKRKPPARRHGRSAR
jgi:hypothetical protein